MKKISQKTYAIWLGVILLAVGLLGLFSENMVLGLFEVSSAHNWVHILSGVLALLAGLAGGGAYAAAYNKTFGLVYLLVAALGFLSVGFVVELLALNMADNILHVLIGAVTTWVGFKA